MGLFGRKATPRQDDDLTMLTVAEAERLRALVRVAFAERGLEATVFADHLRDDAGREFGLWNVAAACAAAEREREWPAVVDDHVGRLLGAMDGPDPFETMSEETLRASVFLRLYDVGGLPGPEMYGYAEELVPGVLELLALDLPESIMLLSDDDVERFGGAAALRGAALANLRAVEDLEHEVLRLDDGTRFDVVLGESLFTASLALLLPELVARTTGDADLPDGVLVCMPYRHQVAFSVVRDASALPTIGAMTGFALDGYGEGAGPLSPWLYWWRNGTWTQLSGQVDGSDEVVVSVPPELGEVLDRLTG